MKNRVLSFATPVFFFLFFNPLYAITSPVNNSANSNDVEKELSEFKTFPSSGPLEKAIIKDKYTFGVTGISSAKKRQVKILNIYGVEPDYNAIKSGRYTMYRPLYLTYSSLYKLPKNEKKEVKHFLKFIKSDEAAAIIKANGVVPFKEGFHLINKRKDIFGG